MTLVSDGGMTDPEAQRLGRIELAISINNAVYTVNAFRPVKQNPLLFGQSFFAAWLTIELAWFHLIWQVLATAWFGFKGAWRSREGKLALGLSVASIAGLVVSLRQSLNARHEVKAALEGLHVPPPTPHRHPVKITKDIVFAEVDGVRLKLDVTHPVAPPPPGEKRPILVQVHGGGWVIGDKREQGLPLIKRMASDGWVCFNVNYRLSPKVAFPAHIEDVKRAIAWVREHAEEYGADPEFVAITGGSAGGHLTALAGLTGNDPLLQRGFEDADTSVQAAVPIYGIYDFLDRHGHWQKGAVERFVEPWVMKSKRHEAPEMWALASPLDQVGPHAPPFLVVHGDKDTLASVEGARLFAEELGKASHSPVHYLELKGAQHAFEVFPSIRTKHVIDGVSHFLEAMYDRHLQQKAELEHITVS